MTQKDKNLLLLDLSARLPHGLLCSMGLDYPLPLQRIFVNKLDGILLDFYEDGKDYQVYLSEVKPYLRPLSSMTDKEKKEYGKVCELDTEILAKHPMNGEPFPALYNSQDWLNKHHFDYRGLIPMGLALEATPFMYVHFGDSKVEVTVEKLGKYE